MATDTPDEKGDDEFWSLTDKSIAPPVAPPVVAGPEVTDGRGADAEMGGGPARSKGKLAALVAIVVVVIAAGVVVTVKLTGGSSTKAVAATAAGPGGQPGRGGTFGTLTSRSGTRLTVTSPTGQAIAVTTSASTTFSKAVSGGLADIKAGDVVMAAGAADAAGTITATRIVDQGARPQGQGPGQFGGRRGTGASGPNPAGRQGAPPADATGSGGGAVGTVKAINGSSLVLSSFGGTEVTVVTDGATQFSVVKTVTLADLTIGQPVTVRGQVAADGSIAATSVREGAAGFGRRRQTTDTSVVQ